MIKLQNLVTNGGVKPQLEDGDYAVCLALEAGALELKLVPTDGLPGGSALPSTQPNQVLAGPASGASPAAASGRALVEADIPVEIARVSALAGYQPVDSDLTAIAALATTTFGRSLLTSADAAALRALTGIEGSGSVLGVAGSSSPTLTLAQRNVRLTTVLTDDRTITLPASAPDGHRIIISDPNGYALNSGGGFTRYIDPPAGESIDGQVGSVVFPAYALLELVKAGSDWRLFLAFPSTQQALARAQLGLGSAATQDAISFQAADSDLAAIAALTTTTFGRSLLTLADAAAARSALGLGTAATSASTDFAAATHTHPPSAVQMATARILGRTTAGSGGAEEITIGTGLSLSGGTLSNSASGPSAANPTASVGTAAVNGSASTYMRSDAAPAVDLAMAPTWTATHTFRQSLAANTAGVGIALENTTAATSGSQRYSPATSWTGQGWKTNSTAASQAVAFRAYAEPVQGAAAPTGLWRLQSSINGGAFTTVFSVDDTGGIQAMASNAYHTIGNATGAQINLSWDAGTGRMSIRAITNPNITFVFDSARTQMRAANSLGWTDNNSSNAGTFDTGMVRDASGRMAIIKSATVTDYGDLRVRSIFTSTKTPASASDTGTTGEIAWDSSCLYVCVATNTWKRAALASW
ncbi:MAG: hypothetical protein JSR82_24440 [Verrucomicrobia bacterium]|nr:hypothetical protein [Verrucomicrobiota bacterium]